VLSGISPDQSRRLPFTGSLKPAPIREAQGAGCEGRSFAHERALLRTVGGLRSSKDILPSPSSRASLKWPMRPRGRCPKSRRRNWQKRADQGNWLRPPLRGGGDGNCCLGCLCPQWGFGDPALGLPRPRRNQRLASIRAGAVWCRMPIWAYRAERRPELSAGVVASPGHLEATAARSAEFDAKSRKFEQERKSASGGMRITCRQVRGLWKAHTEGQF
jgi:hypothetical protein